MTQGIFDPQLVPTAWFDPETQPVGFFDSSLVTNAVQQGALFPSLYTNTQTFYSATVGRGTVNLSAPLLTNSQTFYSPTVAQVTLLAPSLYTNNQTFYGATVTTTRNLTPSLFTNGQTFYSPTRTSSNAVAPNLYTNSQVFYSPAASTTYSLFPPMFADSEFIFSPTVTLGGPTQDISPSLFVNNNVFYPAAIIDPPVEAVGGGGGDASTSTRPRSTKRKKTGFANERAIFEAALSADRVAKNIGVLSDSKLAAAKKAAKSLDSYLNEKGTADALQRQLDKLLAQLSVKGANDQVNSELNADLQAAADEIQQFLNDEQDAINILLLDQENDDALLLMAIGF